MLLNAHFHCPEERNPYTSVNDGVKPTRQPAMQSGGPGARDQGTRNYTDEPVSAAPLCPVIFCFPKSVCFQQEML